MEHLDHTEDLFSFMERSGPFSLEDAGPLFREVIFLFICI